MKCQIGPMFFIEHLGKPQQREMSQKRTIKCHLGFHCLSFQRSGSFARKSWLFKKEAIYLEWPLTLIGKKKGREMQERDILLPSQLSEACFVIPGKPRKVPISLLENPSTIKFFALITEPHSLQILHVDGAPRSAFILKLNSALFLQEPSPSPENQNFLMPLAPVPISIDPQVLDSQISQDQPSLHSSSCCNPPAPSIHAP